MNLEEWTHFFLLVHIDYLCFQTSFDDFQSVFDFTLQWSGIAMEILPLPDLLQSYQYRIFLIAHDTNISFWESLIATKSYCCYKLRHGRRCKYTHLASIAVQCKRSQRSPKPANCRFHVLERHDTERSTKDIGEVTSFRHNLIMCLILSNMFIQIIIPFNP